MLARYRMFAGYNAWCNERLYEAAAQFPTPNTEPIEVLISGHSTAPSTICLWVTASGCGVLPLKARSRWVLMPSYTMISSCCAKRVALKTLDPQLRRKSE